MNKTVTINLSGTVFHIEEHAYTVLEKYLDLIELSLEPDDDKKEILQDVELRISELFREAITEVNQVITLKMVEQVVEVLGEPDAFSNGSQEAHSAKRGEHNPTRKLYRDTDNRIAGGVCSGLGAYFSIDPLVLRILFVIFALMFFSGAIIYLILWFVIPEARTTAEKLEMRGRPVTFENIKRTVKAEFEDVKRNFKKW
jgi:phage shock protein PspC (stress-responsive transcriptional regulator)